MSRRRNNERRSSCDKLLTNVEGFKITFRGVEVEVLASPKEVTICSICHLLVAALGLPANLIGMSIDGELALVPGQRQRLFLSPSLRLKDSSDRF